jgi:hypothetical protein
MRLDPAFLSLMERLEELRSAFAEVQGHPFAHFFCPILFTDEEVELCKGHIVNRAIRDGQSAWTVQRKDVDNFYGSYFESDFVDIKHFETSLFDIITDRSLARKFNARILVNDEPVEFFHSNQPIPEHFTRVKIDGQEPNVGFGLKMHPTDLVALEGQHWETEISRDVRLPMLVSLIKAAHLTLFEMLGYRYALNNAGRFVGHQILGEFFLQNRQKIKSKMEIVEKARSFFAEFVHIVRPVVDSGFDSKGTINDNALYVCMSGSGKAWGMIVFVKTDDKLHAVLIPVFDQPDQVATYFDFLRNSNESIQVAYCRFRGDSWEISKNTKPLTWLKNGVLLG